MSARFAVRVGVVAGAAWYSVLRAVGRRRAGAVPERILVAHHLLLGDTIMLAALLKKLRLRYPSAAIVMTVPHAYVSLFAGRPYGVEAVPFDPRRPADLRALRARRGFDLALLPAETRYSWLARALGGDTIAAFEERRAKPGNWLVTDWRNYPEAPTALVDLFAGLVDGPAPPAYAVEDWPAPPCAPFARPPSPYCVLHLGAGNPNRYWGAERWRGVAAWARARGLGVVLSTGPGEEQLAAALDPEGRYPTFAGSLDLAQMWHLLRGAAFVVCPDTGIAHLAAITATPAVVLFGQGSPSVTGPGDFWRHNRFAAVWEEDVPCRDQRSLFGRTLPWVRRCARRPGECDDPVCMHVLGTERVIAALDRMLGP